MPHYGMIDNEFPYPEVVRQGAKYVRDNFPMRASKPRHIQPIFLCSGDGVLECQIIRVLKILGYQIDRCWFVDAVYKSGGNIRNSIIKILQAPNEPTPQILDAGAVIQRRHDNLIKGNTTTTKESIVNLILNNDYIVSPSFKNLHMVLENYVDAKTTFVVLGVNPCIAGDDHEKRVFGGFLRMLIEKFKVKTMASLWKKESTWKGSVVLRKDASMFQGDDDLAFTKKFFEQPGGRTKPKSKPNLPKKVKKDATGRPK